jgi:hypothetical protein
VERDNKVFIEKTCPKHGAFSEIYWSDAELYKFADRFAHDGNGVQNPMVTKADPVCPKDCGLCNKHKSTTALANLFITNRCDMACFYCFANVHKIGHVFEPDLATLDKMLKSLRSERPVATKAIQITGGEPTLRKDLVDIIQLCKENGFTHIQLNTNGINLGNNPELAKNVRAAGVNTVYLSFDSIKNNTLKGGSETLKAIENCRAAKLGIVLVPTIIGGYNLDEVGDIIKFAVKNMDIIRGINFQPVSFVGSMPKSQREKQRVTIPDLLHTIEAKMGGEIAVKDFYPVPSVTSITHFVEALTKKPQLELGAHPHCGMATYVFVDDGKLIPITRFVDVEGLFNFIKQSADEIKDGGKLSKAKVALKALWVMNNLVDSKKAPKGFDMRKLLFKMLTKHDYKALGEFHYKSLFIGTMHFQDAYNYDVERVKRCVIHYVQPDGSIIPFCAFNGLPSLYLARMQEKWGMPVSEWEKMQGRTIKSELYKRLE